MEKLSLKNENRSAIGSWSRGTWYILWSYFGPINIGYKLSFRIAAKYDNSLRFNREKQMFQTLHDSDNIVVYLGSYNRV